jgi:hypothetical protein
MDNPQTLATSDTQERRRTLTKKNEHSTEN